MWNLRSVQPTASEEVSSRDTAGGPVGDSRYPYVYHEGKVVRNKAYSKPPEPVVEEPESEGDDEETEELYEDSDIGLDSSEDTGVPTMRMRCPHCSCHLGYVKVVIEPYDRSSSQSAAPMQKQSTQVFEDDDDRPVKKRPLAALCAK